MKLVPFTSRITKPNLEKLKILAAKSGKKLYQQLNHIIEHASK
jgi:hypothetical protein